MSWREDYKLKFMGITKAVIRHDAPVEMEVVDEIFAGFESRKQLHEYTQDYVHIILADKNWPKLPRRTKITCPVTGEETNHPFGLSGRAWDLIEAGLTFEKEKQEQAVETKQYCFHSGWGYDLTKQSSVSLKTRYNRLDGGRADRSDYLQELILQLIGKKTREIRLPAGKETPEDMGYIWLPAIPFESKLLYDRKVKVISLRPEEAEILRKIVTTVQWAKDSATRHAKEEGSNLLLALAQNPDSIEQFNAVRSGDDPN